MKCIECNRDIKDGQTMILMNSDGDFTCSIECDSRYRRKRDKFFNETIHDDNKMKEWWNE